MRELLVDEAIAGFRARLEMGRAIDRFDVEERVAIRLEAQVPGLDVAIVEHAGLVRLFVRPASADGWTSRYVWRLELVDALLSRVLVTAAEVRAA